MIDWDEPGAKDALVSALVNDANALLAALAGIDDGDECDERGRLRRWRCWRWSPGRMWSPPRASDGTDGRWRIARKVAPDRVISTVDPEARHTRKSPEARRDGYRAHVAAEPETGIITDEALTKAAGHGELRRRGGRAVPGRRRDAAGGATGVREWYGDSAYGTGDLRGAIARRRTRRGDQAQAARLRRSRAGSPWTTSPSTRPPPR